MLSRPVEVEPEFTGAASVGRSATRPMAATAGTEHRPR
jgi:hypothetical protein